MADPCRASACGIGVPRQVNASGLREGCCVAIRRRGPRFLAYRVAFGAPIRGRDPCPPYPRRQAEMHRPDAPIATEQGSEWRPHPRSRASRTQLSPIASGHVVREEPRLSTNPRRTVRTLAPTSGGWISRQRGGWSTGMMAKPADPRIRFAPTQDRESCPAMGGWACGFVTRSESVPHRRYLGQRTCVSLLPLCETQNPLRLTYASI